MTLDYLQHIISDRIRISRYALMTAKEEMPDEFRRNIEMEITQLTDFYEELKTLYLVKEGNDEQFYLLHLKP